MSFFGGGTDMESFFREYGGAVLSTTFDKYCYVNVRHLPRFFDYSTELSYSKTERVNDIDQIQHPAIRNAMKMLDMYEIRLTYEADLPARSGLGTSSSFAVGMLNAFYALNHQLEHPSVKHPGRTKFFNELKSGHSIRRATVAVFPKESIKQSIKTGLIKLKLLKDFSPTGGGTA